MPGLSAATTTTVTSSTSTITATTTATTTTVIVMVVAILCSINLVVGAFFLYWKEKSQLPKREVVFSKAMRIRLFGDDPQGEVIIPERLDGELVTMIGARAFVNCSGATGIIIPNSVTTIDAGAFRGCSGATTFIIPNSVTWIGSWTFRDCTGLTSIVIPNSVTYIGDWTFTRCPQLNKNEIKFSLPVRSLFPYKWKTSNSKLFSVLDYLFEFFSWREVAQLTRLSKGFYSNIVVRSRQHFLHQMLGDNATIITKTDVTVSPELMITGANYSDFH